MTIQPIRQPGTRNLLVRPPQERTGTLRESLVEMERRRWSIGHRGGEGGDWHVGLSRKHKVVVDLVSCHMETINDSKSRKLDSGVCEAKDQLDWKLGERTLTYNGHLVSLSNVKDLSEVGWREDRAARIGGRVDDDGGRVVVDEGLHVAQVDHPVVVGEQVVLPGLDPQPS